MFFPPAIFSALFPLLPTLRKLNILKLIFINNNIDIAFTEEAYFMSKIKNAVNQRKKYKLQENLNGDNRNKFIIRSFHNCI